VKIRDLKIRSAIGLKVCLHVSVSVSIPNKSGACMA
jgi:hypothetical protein